MSAASAKEDAQAILDGPTQRKHFGSSARMVSVAQKGTETVGGLPMFWQLGTLEKDGKTSEGFLGAVVDKSKPKTVLIIGIQPTGTYNLPETKEFLKSIKSF
jgi:hypothetical protein